MILPLLEIIYPYTFTTIVASFPRTKDLTPLTRGRLLHSNSNFFWLLF